MKLVLGIVIGVILGIIVAGAGAFYGIRSLTQALSSESVSGLSSSEAGQATTPSLFMTSAPTPASTSTPHPSISTPLTSAAPGTSQTPSVILPPIQGSVNFTLNLISYNIFGPTSATLDLQITNTGNIDAHHVWGKVELFYQGTLVKINGQDYYRADIGDIKSRASVTTRVDLNVNLIDGSKILANGGTFNLTVFSDEYTQNFRFNFKL
jgi:hypothetical protein